MTHRVNTPTPDLAPVNILPPTPNSPWTSTPWEASLEGMKPPSNLDTDTRELVNHLFAVATAILEDAIEAGLAGQSPNLTLRACESHARRLTALADDIAAQAVAALVIARQSRPPTSKRSARRRS